jgi:hypothetical protein
LGAAIVFNHVPPFAGQPVPERDDHDTFKVTVLAGLDYRIASLRAPSSGERSLVERPLPLVAKPFQVKD